MCCTSEWSTFFICPNCKNIMNALILMTTWLEKEDSTKGCQVEGIGEDTVIVIPFNKSKTAVTYDGTEVRMTFMEFVTKYEKEFK